MLKERKSAVVVGFNLLFIFIMHIHTVAQIDWSANRKAKETYKFNEM